MVIEALSVIQQVLYSGEAMYWPGAEARHKEYELYDCISVTF